MKKILISHCLLGAKVRYDGQGHFIDHPLIKQWMEEGRLVAVCPEVEAGMSIPRTPSEIVNTGGGTAVLHHHARIKDRLDKDVTNIYIRGAHIALEAAQKNNITLAILKERSPSCGSSMIYDGSFSGQKIAGMGVTTALLREHGILVFNETQLELVAAQL